MILASYMPQADVMALHDPQGPPDAPDDADVISLEILGVDVFDIDSENGTQMTAVRHEPSHRTCRYDDRMVSPASASVSGSPPTGRPTDTPGRTGTARSPPGRCDS